MKYLVIVGSIVVLPFFFIVSNTRLLMTPAFVAYEYHSAGFPPAEVSAVEQERQPLANVALLSIIAPGGLDALRTASFANGERAFDQREVSHMADVRALVQRLFQLWWLALIAGGGVVIWLWRRGRKRLLATGLLAGGLATLSLLMVMTVIATVAFEPFFIAFHHLFFRGNSWLFPETSTLIQLFPLPFWSNATLLLGLATISEGALSVVMGLWWRRRLTARQD